MSILQKQLYLKDILTMLKQLSFHELYMQKQRQSIADQEYFDPFTAFKFLDLYKHNMITPMQLKSFMDNQQIDITIFQAQELIKSLNKAQQTLNYQRFIEFILPYNIKKKNVSLTRFNKVEVEVGTFAKINQIKNRTLMSLKGFLLKEVEFIGKFLALRQQFCRKWGADVYTIAKQLFTANSQKNSDKTLKNPLFDYQSKNNFFSTSNIINLSEKSQISFTDFYEFSRVYQIYFNKEQFKAIWRRIKTTQENIILKPEQVFINKEDLIQLFLINNFNTKQHFAGQFMIKPSQISHTQPPSYKLPINQSLLHNTYQYNKHRQDEQVYKKIAKIKDEIGRPQLGLRYKYTYPEYNGPRTVLQQKQEEIYELFNRMSDIAIEQKYNQILSKDKNMKILTFNKNNFY